MSTSQYLAGISAFMAAGAAFCCGIVVWAWASSPVAAPLSFFLPW